MLKFYDLSDEEHEVESTKQLKLYNKYNLACRNVSEASPTVDNIGKV